MRITAISSTDLFRGTALRPLQVIRVGVANDGPGMLRRPDAEVTVAVRGPGVRTPAPATLRGLAAGEQRVAEVAAEVAGPAAPGAPRRVTAVARTADGQWELPGEITVAEPGWTMWMICHFHYDPVWWNTQGAFTESWVPPRGDGGAIPEVRAAFELVRLHLEEARRDPDYKFVLAEIDYLKPYFDAHPQDRADLRDLIAAGRVEIVGGSYNEPNTNLTCAESTIRNAVHGLGYQRGVLGADPATAWMLDAFGFDPAYPGLMAAAGLTSSAWARGPFHQWGPDRAGGGSERMQFPSEFEWISPDGGSLLTSYMPSHYSAGWATQRAADLEGAEQAAYEQFRQLAPVAATRNVLLPVGGDHVVPSRWAAAIHRDWNARYTWPRFVTALPREFFAAVRAQARADGTWIMPQTRDMNPVYPGKDVSYIDTKQAQRDAEIALLDGERLAALAWLAGAAYPAASLDKAWRLLEFGAHHDAITGTEGDQVYLDLLAGWREAFERGDQARRDALAHLAGRIDTRSLAAAAGAGGPPPAGARAVVVANTLARPRDGMAVITLEFTAGSAGGLRLAGPDGAPVPFLADPVARHPDGSLAAVTLTFRALAVPALGYRAYLAVPEPPGAGGRLAGSGWHDVAGLEIGNGAFRVTADEAAGGTLRSVIDQRTGAELLAGPGNELVLGAEYPTHPRWGEGPWLLCPTGTARGSAQSPAKARAQRSPVGSRILAEYSIDDLRVTAETLLWDGSGLVEFRTHVDGSIGTDRLLRVRFAAAVPGGLPVYQTGLSVIGRTPGPADVDVAEHPYTLDNPAHEWFGVGSAARLALAIPGGGRAVRAIGVAEVIAPAGPPGDRFAPRDPGAGGAARAAVRDLMAALARQGVTATLSVPAGGRYGLAELDSNLPDIRIALGGPEANAFTAEVLARAPRAAACLEDRLRARGTARVWVPAARSRGDAFTAGADLRGARDLPVLIVAGGDLSEAIAGLAADLAGGEAAADCPDPGADGEADLAGHCVALLNRGLPGSLVTPSGALLISLMRACTAWPAGAWIDGEPRRLPDGSSFAWQHWSHTFEYALAAGAGDWRSAGFAQAGREYSHPLLACEAGIHPGPWPAERSLGAVSPDRVDLMALKPRGNPVAPAGQPDPADGVTVRLRDLGGRGPAEATVRLFTGICSAAVTGLLEDEPGPAVRCDGGTAAVRVPERGLVTLAAIPGPGTAERPAAPARAAAQGAAGAARPPEPIQPVFTRYWLHGKGPAPAGNLPVTVHLSPAGLAIAPGGAASAALTVASGVRPARGAVRLEVPGGLRVTPAGPLRYDLPAHAHMAWDLAVAAPPPAPPARWFLTARITADDGQELQDAIEVTVGEPPGPPDELTLLSGDLALPPGGRGQIAARLANHAASPVRGEAQLLSPHGSWALARPWAAAFAAGPHASATIRFAVTVPWDARPGQRWWALVKVMYFGRVRYTEPAWITVTAGAAGR